MFKYFLAGGRVHRFDPPVARVSASHVRYENKPGLLRIDEDPMKFE
jgi:hypothetical protein